MTVHTRREVVWYPAVFGDYDRPFCIISTDRHPYHGDEYIGLAITTTASPDALEIPSEAWRLGTLPRPSYLKPWNPLAIQHDRIVSIAGVLSEPLVDTAVAELGRLCGLAAAQ